MKYPIGDVRPNLIFSSVSPLLRMLGNPSISFSCLPRRRADGGGGDDAHQRRRQGRGRQSGLQRVREDHDVIAGEAGPHILRSYTPWFF